MSTHACEHCNTVCHDLPSLGYATGCEHYPPDCYCAKRIIGQCALCTIRERIKAGEPVQDVLRDYE